MREAWDPSEYAITPSSFEITRLISNEKNDDDDDGEKIHKNFSGALSQKEWEKLRKETPASRDELDAPWHGFGTASPSLLEEERGVDAGSERNSEEELGGEGGRLEALVKGTTTTQVRGDHPQQREQQRNQQLLGEHGSMHHPIGQVDGRDDIFAQLGKFSSFLHLIRWERVY